MGTEVSKLSVGRETVTEVGIGPELAFRTRNSENVMQLAILENICPDPVTDEELTRSQIRTPLNLAD